MRILVSATPCCEGGRCQIHPTRSVVVLQLLVDVFGFCELSRSRLGHLRKDLGNLLHLDILQSRLGLAGRGNRSGPLCHGLSAGSCGDAGWGSNAAVRGRGVGGVGRRDLVLRSIIVLAGIRGLYCLGAFGDGREVEAVEASICTMSAHSFIKLNRSGFNICDCWRLTVVYGCKRSSP